MGLSQVDVGAVAPDRLAALLSPRRGAELAADAAPLRAVLGGMAPVHRDVTDRDRGRRPD